MSERILLAVSLLVVVGLPGCRNHEDGGTDTAGPPNVVFILADDLGWADVNSFDPLDRGYYETPHIDALAAEGLRFTEAYTNAANCSPTRAALISGQYFPNQPIYHVGASGDGPMIPAENADALPPEKVTLAEALGEGGYHTTLIGKWHIGSPPDTGPKAQGFDVNIGGYEAGNPGNWDNGYFAPNNNPHISDAHDGEYLTEYLTRKATSYIEDHQDEPFYLQLSYYTPHWPLQAPESRAAKYQKKDPRGGHNNPTYAAMIESLDHGVGRVLATLDSLNLAEETIVVFYSDNGGHGSFQDLGQEENGITDNSPLKAGKGSFYEGGIRVPMIVRWPEVTEAGTQTDEPVTSIDFYPTLLAAAGIDRPQDYLLDGVNMMPVLRDPSASLDREALFWHFPGYPNNPWRTTPVSVIRSGDWKLMKFYQFDRLELYNLGKDTEEAENLAEERPQKREELHKRLKSWLEETSAPMPRHPNQ